MERVYIGMGSNLADPADQLRSAVQALAQLPDSRLIGVSAFYQSDSLLPGQPRYTNAVAAIDSSLAPLDLLDALQAIELDQGRERQERWGPALKFRTTTCTPGLLCCIRWPNWRLHR